MPAVLGEEPVRLPEDHWWIEGLAHAWPTGSTGTHEVLISGSLFISEFEEVQANSGPERLQIGSERPPVVGVQNAP